MWSIKDQYGSVVAKDFYAHIFGGDLGNKKLESAKAAHALHYATQNIQKELGDCYNLAQIFMDYLTFSLTPVFSLTCLNLSFF